MSQTDDVLGVDLVGPAVDNAPITPSRMTTCLAPTQLAVLGAEVWASHPAEYTVVSAARMTGLSDWTALPAAVQTVFARHDVFTWRVRMGPGAKLLAERGHQPVVVSTRDLTMFEAAQAQTLVEQHLMQERWRPIRLLGGDNAAPDSRRGPGGSRSCPTRVVVFRIPVDNPAGDGEEAVCALTTHHLYVDERSVQLLWSQIAAEASGPDTKTPDRSADEEHDAFARWAAAAHSDRSRAEGSAAADELTQALSRGPIAHLRADADCSTVHGVHRTGVPDALHDELRAAASRATCSITTLYTLAVTRALRPMLTDGRLLIRMPMSRRRTAQDMAVMGCFVTSIPVVAELESSPSTAALPDAHEGGETGGAWSDGIQLAALAEVRAWAETLAFSSRRVHADLDRLRSALPQGPNVSLFVESPSSGGIGGVRWRTLALPDSPAKDDLVVFISLPGKGAPGHIRVVWRDGVDAAAAMGLGPRTARYARQLAQLILASHRASPFESEP